MEVIAVSKQGKKKIHFTLPQEEVGEDYKEYLSDDDLPLGTLAKKWSPEWVIRKIEQTKNVHG